MQQRLLSFGEFEHLYESYGFVMEAEAAVPPKTTEKAAVVDPKTGEPSEDVEELLSVFQDLSKESLKEATEAPKAGNVSTLKPVKLGETSDRVKEIQKILGLDTDGQYGPATQKAVMAFQKENKLQVDGIVGVQTYGKMLEVKKGITDKEELEKKKEEFKKMSDKLSAEILSIINDPRYYEIYERIEIVNINGVTYVICTPKSDAKAKVEKLKEEGLITSGFEWLLAAAEAVGKAVVYTAIGLAVVTTEVAKAMVNGVISAFKFVGNAVMNVTSSVVYGLGQIGKWAYLKTKAVLDRVAVKAEELWKGFVSSAGKALKSTGEGLVAFAGAVGNYLKSVGQAAGTVLVALGNLALEILKPVGKVLGIAWEGAKTLAQAAKSGLNWIAQKGKAVLTAAAQKIKQGYTYVVDKVKSVGSSVLSGLKNAGKAVTTAVGKGITYAGQKIAEFGGWVSGLFESLYQETGNMIFETVSQEVRLGFIYEDLTEDIF